MNNEGPLSGIRILDLTRVLAGPYGAMLLADLGAEVIKIEEPKGGDSTRSMGPPFVNGVSAYFISINRNKKSVTLDLKSKNGKNVFYDLVRESDIVLDNYRPNILKKLHISYNELKRINPRIITCSISAFGRTGPYKEMPAFDLSLQAMGGAMSITGEPGHQPVRMGIPMGDLAGGMFAAYAISSALFEREKTGKGSEIDIGLLDCQVSLLTYVAQYFLANGKVPKPIGSSHQTIVPYQAFKTKDGYIVIAILVEKFWKKLCGVLGLSKLADDPKFSENRKRLENKGKLIPILERKFLEKKTADWLKQLSKEGIPSAPINTVDKVLSDPQVLHRRMLQRINHSICGDISIIGNPVKLKGMKEKFSSPPLLGEHTVEILRRLLKYSNKKIESLKNEGVI